MRPILPEPVLSWLTRRDRKLPLGLVLIVPFVLEITAVVGLTGYLSFRNGQEAVNKIAVDLRDETTTRVVQYLNHYLATPTLINRINADAVRLGQLNFDDSAQLERHLFAQLQQFTAVSHILVGTEQGTLRIASRTPQPLVMRSDPIDPSRVEMVAVDRNGNPTQILETLAAFNVRQRPWYRVAAQAEKPVRVPVFQLADGSDFSLNASWPIYDPDGNLRGVFSAASDLSYLKRFLTSLRIGQTGRVFVVERDGLLIGTSSTEQLRSTQRSNVASLDRLQAVESEDSLIRSTSRYLMSQFADFRAIQSVQRLTFMHDDDRQFVQVVPYRDAMGLDWLIVVVVPESDFMAEINHGNRTTLLLCTIALIGAIGLGLLTAYWIAKPILQLSRVSQAMALGQWEQSVYAESSIAELAVLARSFNQMTEHLQDSFDQVKSALRESEAKFTKIFHASPDPIAIVELDGRFLEVNASFLKIFGYSKAELIGKTVIQAGLWTLDGSPAEWLDQRSTPFFLDAKPGIPPNLEYCFRNKSGELKTVLFSSEPIELNGRRCLLGIAKDINNSG